MLIKNEYETRQKLLSLSKTLYVNERTAQYCSQTFRKADETLEDEEGHGHPPAVNDNQMKPLLKWTHAEQLKRLRKN